MGELIYTKVFDVRATVEALKPNESVIIPFGMHSVSGLRSIITKYCNAGTLKYRTQEVPTGIKITRVPHKDN